MNDELNKIMSILEKVRSEKYPNFPQHILKDVLEIQATNKSDPVLAQKKITKYFKEYFGAVAKVCV